MSYPIFWPIVFYSLFESIFTSYFLKFLHFISQYFYQFISRHPTCLYLGILCVRFAIILLVFSQIFIHFNLIFIFLSYDIFTFIFSIYSPLKTEKSRRFRRNFGKEVTLKYLIWFQKDSFKFFIYLFISFYPFIFSLFYLKVF